MSSDDGSIPLPHRDFDALPTGEGPTDEVIWESPVEVGAMLVNFDWIVCLNWTDDEVDQFQSYPLKDNVRKPKGY